MKGATDQAKPWTPRHVAEAKAALYRLAAEASARGVRDLARVISAAVTWKSSTGTVGGFVAELARLVDAARILRILRTVRARAEGREVVTVETRWCVRLANGKWLRRYDGEDSDDGTDYAPDAAEWGENYRANALQHGCADHPGSRLVHVTLTRRRYLPAPKEG